MVSSFCLFQATLAAVLEKEERLGLVNGKEELVQIPTISSATSTVLKGLFMVMDYLFRDKCRLDINWCQKSLSVALVDSSSLLCEGLQRTTGWLYRGATLGPIRSHLTLPMPRAFSFGLARDNDRVFESRRKYWRSASGVSTLLWWEVRCGIRCHGGHFDLLTNLNKVTIYGQLPRTWNLN